MPRMTEPEAGAQYRAPIGTRDVLPPESDRWIAAVVDVRGAGRPLRVRAGRHAGVRALRSLPTGRGVAPTSCARRCTNSSTRAVGGSRSGPRGPRPSCAAYVQHRPTPPWKVWYVAPNFRYERPQKGRYRQHWQLGAEVLGVDDPDVDVEVIALAHGFYRDLGLKQVTLLLNSMGDSQSRPGYLAALSEYLLDHAAALGDEFRERVEQNPLRLLDSKREDWQDVIERAPQLTEHLSDEAEAHFESVQQRLCGSRHRVRARAAPRARFRLLHEHHLRVRQRRARCRPERGGRRRALRPVGRGHGRSADARDRLRNRYRTGVDRLRRRGSARRQRPRSPRRVRRSTAWATAPRSCSSRSCANRACAPTAPTVAGP